jgi:hypothetical protein
MDQWVTCLPLDEGFAGLNPAEDDGFSRAIKICNLTSFGGEGKPSVPCRKILRHVEKPCKYEKDKDDSLPGHCVV